MFVITQLHPFGGAQQFLLKILENLDLLLFEPVVVGGYAENSRIERFCLAQNIALKPLKSLVRSISPVNDYRAYQEIQDLIRAEKPDTLFLLSSKAGFLGALAAKNIQRTTDGQQPKVVYRIGGWAFNDPRSWLSKQLYIWAERLSAKWKDVIIVNSKHDAKQSQDLGIKPKEKLVTIYNGLAPDDLIYLDRNEARQRITQFSPSLGHSVTLTPWIGCIANFYKTKGLPYLIEAMANVHRTNPDAKLVIIGDGMERKELEFVIKKEGLEEMIFLPGHLENAQQYLKAFDIFVLPSLKEGFPWALIEAMAAGIPVAATRVGAVPEIIVHEKNGLIVGPGDAEALANAMKKLLGDGKLQSDLASHGKGTVENNFQLDAMIKEVIALLG